MSSWQVFPHLRWWPYVGLSFHDGVLISIPPIPGKFPNVSFGVLNGTIMMGSLIGGKILPGDKPDNELRGMWGLQFMGRTTDAGIIAPHVSIPPNNIVTPLTILLGGSESLVGASGIQINCRNWLWSPDGDEADMATCCIPYVPLGLNLGCNDPFFMPDMVISPNNILVGLELADLFKTLIDVAFRVLIEGAMMGVGKYGGKALKQLKLRKAIPKKVAPKAFQKGAGRTARKARAKSLAPVRRRAKAGTRPALRRVRSQGSNRLGKKGLRTARQQAKGLPPPRLRRGSRQRNLRQGIPPKRPQVDLPAAERPAWKQAFDMEFREGGKATKPGIEMFRIVGARLTPWAIGTAMGPVNDAIQEGLGTETDGTKTINQIHIREGELIVKEVQRSDPAP